MSPTSDFHRSPALLSAGAVSALAFLLMPVSSRAQTAPTDPAAPPPSGTVPAAPASPTPPDTTKPAPPPPQPAHRSRFFQFGPEAGVYLPTASKTRSAFGSDWFNIGLGVGGIQRARYGGQVQFDFGLYGTAKSDRRILIAPIGLTYRRALTKSRSVGPYAGVSADADLTQLRSDSEGIRSRIRGTPGGSVFIGTTLQDRAYLQARYFGMGKIRGYDFSGLNLSAGFRF